MKSTLLWAGLVSGLGLVLGGCETTSSSASPVADLEVGVRSYVTDKSILWSNQPGKKPGEGGHGKVYGIVAVKEVKSERDLAKPVNEGAVTSLLMDQLDANGFREFKKGQRPEILLTVSYGRGQMTNPYVRDTGAVGGSSGAPNPGIMPDSKNGEKMFDNPTPMASYTKDNPPPTVTITGAMALQLMDERGVGFEQKLQKAKFEKLFIRVTAWSNPQPGEDPEPVMLWKAIMVVDDPDNRDLNAVAGAMLEAGAPYFDKEIRVPEAEVHRPLPTTHVNVGPSRVGAPFEPDTTK